MTSTDLLVIVGGLAAIAWIYWYFFVAARRATASGATEARRDITIVVEGGYDPSTIRVPVGQPIQLTFDRRETSSCSEEVVIPALHIRRFLPPHERTTLELTAPAAGTYDFYCGMNMLHGRMIAQ